jgi:hypothetical protein
VELEVKVDHLHAELLERVTALGIKELAKFEPPISHGLQEIPRAPIAEHPKHIGDGSRLRKRFIVRNARR